MEHSLYKYIYMYGWMCVVCVQYSINTPSQAGDCNVVMNTSSFECECGAFILSQWCGVWFVCGMPCMVNDVCMVSVA